MKIEQLLPNDWRKKRKEKKLKEKLKKIESCFMRILFCKIWKLYTGRSWCGFSFRNSLSQTCWRPLSTTASTRRSSIDSSPTPSSPTSSAPTPNGSIRILQLRWSASLYAFIASSCPQLASSPFNPYPQFPRFNHCLFKK